MRTAAFLYSDRLADFDYGDDHPFKPMRARNALELCYRYGLMASPASPGPSPRRPTQPTSGSSTNPPTCGCSSRRAGERRAPSL